MLDPKEIDTYFNAATRAPKPSLPKTVRHTRKVALAKIALPSIAAILAASLLAVAALKKDIKDFSLEFSLGKGEIEKLNIEKTTLYVTDKNNRVNNFIAQSIQETSSGSKIYNLIAPEAIMPTSETEWLNIKSPDGQFDQNTSILHLKNIVETFYSKGMSIQTTEAFFDFNKSFGYSNNEVKGDGFIGKISSEGFEFNGKDNILTFIGKTHILINEESLKEGK